MLTWTLRHPRWTIAITLLCAAMSFIAVRRLHSDTSLDALFSSQSESARALVHVVRDFGAVDDLIVLASLPDEKRAPDLDLLIRFARQLEEQISRSADTVALSDGVFYRADGQTVEFFQKVLVPSAVFYLDDAAFAAAQQRLTAPQMRQQLAQDQAMLATPGPAAGAMAKAFMQDPLRLREFLLDRLASQKPIKTYQGSDAFVSEDGRSILIRVRGKQPPSDLEFCKTFTQRISEAAMKANSDGLKIELTGSYAIAAHSAASIRSDMIASVTGSVICLQLLFLLAYRGAIRLFAVAIAPIALGVLLGFAGYSLLNTGITPLSAVLGGILAGMAIDYSIQYLSHYESRRAIGDQPRAAAESAATIITPAAFAAWFTSIIGFAAVGASSVKMLRDFSILGSLGLAGAFVAVVALLPMMLMLFDRAGHQRIFAFRLQLTPFLNWLFVRRVFAIVISIIVLLVAATYLLMQRGDLLPLESDMTVMHPRPNPALDAQAHLAQRFGIAPDSLIVHLQADSPQRLVELAHDVEKRLHSDAAREAGVTGTYGLATLLPDPRIAPARLAAIGPAEADRVVADFDAAIVEAGFNPQAKPLQDYQTFLRLLLTQTRAPAIDSLLPYRRLAESMLPRSAFDGKPVTQAITLVFTKSGFTDRATRDRTVEGVRRALAGIQGATPTGLSVVGYDTERTIRRDLPRLVWLAAILVLLYLALHFRSVADAGLAMLPTVFSLTLLLAAMRLAGQTLNMVNLVAIPLLIGIDVDYGVFLVSLARVRRARELTREQLIERLAPVCHAVTMCALATIIGFGSLAWTSVPAIRSLGFAVAVGIGACLAAALFLVVPVFLNLAQERSAKSEFPKSAFGSEAQARRELNPNDEFRNR